MSLSSKLSITDVALKGKKVVMRYESSRWSTLARSSLTRSM